jgi:hypothetical protein
MCGKYGCGVYFNGKRFNGGMQMGIDERELRPLYEELQGVLSQTPNNVLVFTNNEWARHNEIVQIIINKSEINEFGRFLVATQRGHTRVGGREQVRATDLRQAMHSLIMYIHGKYYPSEPTPFSGPPQGNVSVNTNVIQTQQVYLQMVVDFVSEMESKINSFPEGAKERTWWTKVKDSMATTNTMVGLLSNAVKLAKDSGLSLDSLMNIFS